MAGGSATTVGLLAWTAAGGFGRPGSIVGAVGCLGLLVTERVSRRMARAARGSVRPG